MSVQEDIPGKGAREQAAFILGCVVGALGALVFVCVPVLLAVALGAPQPLRLAQAVLAVLS